MRASLSAVFVSVALLVNLVTASVARHDIVSKKRHLGYPVVERAPAEQNVTTRSLEKRFNGARFTFYAAGLGACGKTNSASDFVSSLTPLSNERKPNRLSFLADCSIEFCSKLFIRGLLTVKFLELIGTL